MRQSILNFLRTLPPVHRAGWPFVIVFALVAVLLDQASHFFGWLGLLATAWCAYFFRDPERTVPTREGLVISPADGKVASVKSKIPPRELELGTDPLTRVSIFLNVFDVHINRTPVEGEIVAKHYIPGQFLNAELDKSSDMNERMLLTVKTPTGAQVGFMQIAGLVARRIECWVEPGQKLERGERFGLIRFGSRMDVYLPKGVESLVVPGQKVLAGETVLADMQSTEKNRTGTRR